MTDQRSHRAPELAQPPTHRARNLTKALLLATAYISAIHVVMFAALQVGGFLWNRWGVCGNIVIFEGGPSTLLLVWAIYRRLTSEPIKFCDLCGKPTRYSNPSPLAAKAAADIVCCECHRENSEVA